MTIVERNIPRSSLLMVIAACAGLSGPPAMADETLYCGRYIRTLPFRITTPGHYCLAHDLRTGPAPAYLNAITVDADAVWLDLNNFTLDGSAVGPATAMTGILGTPNHGHITVRNGVVRGFAAGINLYGSGGGDTVEGVWADNNYENGIAVRGTAGQHVVRNNVVTNTGGSTNLGNWPGGVANAFGISVLGPSSIINNQVTHTFGMNGGFGLAFELVFEGEGQIAENNRVIGADSLGFQCGSGPSPQVYLRDNVVLGTPTPYDAGCIKIGPGNHP